VQLLRKTNFHRLTKLPRRIRFALPQVSENRLYLLRESGLYRILPPQVSKNCQHLLRK
jgi:hypothetical protein